MPSPLAPLPVSGEVERMLPSPLDGRRAGDEGVVYACPHPWPLSQFRERGSVCSLLPYVEEELGMRGMRAGGRRGEKQPGLLLEDVYVRALGRMVLPADNQQFQPGAAGNQFRQAAAVQDERRG